MGESSRPPPFVICHLCGRKYGTKSISIHIPQCQEKWEAENRKLPKQLRRTLPTQPNYEVLRSGKFNPRAVEDLNAQAFESSKAQLIPCKHCGRTFYPEKLPIHLRSCTADNPSRPPPSSAPPVKSSNTSTSESKQKSILGYNKSRKLSDSRIITNDKSGEYDSIASNARKLSDSQLNSTANESDDSGSRPLNTVDENVKVGDEEAEESSTVLCCICMEQIPRSLIQNHLVRCNEEKAKQYLDEGVIERSRKASRPRTRTLHR